MAEASGSSGGEFLDRSQWERENAFLEKAFLETGCYLGEQETINPFVRAGQLERLGVDPLLLLVARMQVLVSEVGEEEEGEEEVAIQLLEEVPRLAPNIQYSCDYIKLLVDYRTRVVLLVFLDSDPSREEMYATLDENFDPDVYGSEEVLSKPPSLPLEGREEEWAFDMHRYARGQLEKMIIDPEFRETISESVNEQSVAEVKRDLRLYMLTVISELKDLLPVPTLLQSRGDGVERCDDGSGSDDSSVNILDDLPLKDFSIAVDRINLTSSPLPPPPSTPTHSTATTRTSAEESESDSEKDSPYIFSSIFKRKSSRTTSMRRVISTSNTSSSDESTPSLSPERDLPVAMTTRSRQAARYNRGAKSGGRFQGKSSPGNRKRRNLISSESSESASEAVSDASSSSSSSADEAQSSEVRDGREGRSLQQQHTSPPRGVGGVASPRRRVGTRLHDGGHGNEEMTRIRWSLRPHRNYRVAPRPDLYSSAPSLDDPVDVSAPQQQRQQRHRRSPRAICLEQPPSNESSKTKGISNRLQNTKRNPLSTESSESEGISNRLQNTKRNPLSTESNESEGISTRLRSTKRHVALATTGQRMDNSAKNYIESASEDIDPGGEVSDSGRDISDSTGHMEEEEEEEEEEQGGSNDDVSDSDQWLMDVASQSSPYVARQPGASRYETDNAVTRVPDSFEEEQALRSQRANKLRASKRLKEFYTATSKPMPKSVRERLRRHLKRPSSPVEQKGKYKQAAPVDERELKTVQLERLSTTEASGSADDTNSADSLSCIIISQKHRRRAITAHVTSEDDSNKDGVLRTSPFPSKEFRRSPRIAANSPPWAARWSRERQQRTVLTPPTPTTQPEDHTSIAESSSPTKTTQKSPRKQPKQNIRRVHFEPSPVAAETSPPPLKENRELSAQHPRSSKRLRLSPHRLEYRAPVGEEQAVVETKSILRRKEPNAQVESAIRKSKRRSAKQSESNEPSQAGKSHRSNNSAAPNDQVLDSSEEQSGGDSQDSSVISLQGELPGKSAPRKTWKDYEAEISQHKPEFSEGLASSDFETNDDPIPKPTAVSPKKSSRGRRKKHPTRTQDSEKRSPKRTANSMLPGLKKSVGETEQQFVSSEPKSSVKRRKRGAKSYGWSPIKRSPRKTARKNYVEYSRKRRSVQAALLRVEEKEEEERGRVKRARVSAHQTGDVSLPQQQSAAAVERPHTEPAVQTSAIQKVASLMLHVALFSMFGANIGNGAEGDTRGAAGLSVESTSQPQTNSSRVEQQQDSTSSVPDPVTNALDTTVEANDDVNSNVESTLRALEGERSPAKIRDDSSSVEFEKQGDSEIIHSSMELISGGTDEADNVQEDANSLQAGTVAASIDSLPPQASVNALGSAVGRSESNLTASGESHGEQQQETCTLLHSASLPSQILLETPPTTRSIAVRQRHDESRDSDVIIIDSPENSRKRARDFTPDSDSSKRPRTVLDFPVTVKIERNDEDCFPADEMFPFEDILPQEAVVDSERNLTGPISLSSNEHAGSSAEHFKRVHQSAPHTTSAMQDAESYTLDAGSTSLFPVQQPSVSKSTLSGKPLLKSHSSNAAAQRTDTQGNNSAAKTTSEQIPSNTENVTASVPSKANYRNASASLKTSEDEQSEEELDSIVTPEEALHIATTLLQSQSTEEGSDTVRQRDLVSESAPQLTSGLSRSSFEKDTVRTSNDSNTQAPPPSSSHTHLATPTCSSYTEALDPRRCDIDTTAQNQVKASKTGSVVIHNPSITMDGPTCSVSQLTKENVAQATHAGETLMRFRSDLCAPDKTIVQNAKTVLDNLDKYDADVGTLRVCKKVLRSIINRNKSNASDAEQLQQVLAELQEVCSVIELLKSPDKVATGDTQLSAVETGQKSLVNEDAKAKANKVKYNKRRARLSVILKRQANQPEDPLELDKILDDMIKTDVSLPECYRHDKLNRLPYEEKHMVATDSSSEATAKVPSIATPEHMVATDSSSETTAKVPSIATPEHMVATDSSSETTAKVPSIATPSEEEYIVATDSSSESTAKVPSIATPSEEEHMVATDSSSESTAKVPSIRTPSEEEHMVATDSSSESTAKVPSIPTPSEEEHMVATDSSSESTAKVPSIPTSSEGEHMIATDSSSGTTAKVPSIATPSEEEHMVATDSSSETTAKVPSIPTPSEEENSGSSPLDPPHKGPDSLSPQTQTETDKRDQSEQFVLCDEEEEFTQLNSQYSLAAVEKMSHQIDARGLPTETGLEDKQPVPLSS